MFPKFHRTAGFLLLFFTACTADILSLGIEKFPSTPPPAEVSLKKILNHLDQPMEGIQDLQADVAFRVFIKRLGFPFTVQGTYYFKSPDKVKIALHGLPGSLLGSVPQTITAATTFAGFRKDFQKLYRPRFLGIRKIDGQDTYFIEFTPVKDDGNVARTFVWINGDNYTIPKLVTYYKDGSWVNVARTYKPFQNHLLVNHIVASMVFLKSNLEANVDAGFSKYQLNQNLDDSIFEEKKGKG